MVLKTSHNQYPPFAEGLTAAPLVSISLARLESCDDAESAAFYNAAKDLGFFYLDMDGSALGEGIVAGAEQLHVLQKQFNALPVKLKEEFLREKIDAFFGYRFQGNRSSEDGRVGRSEMYNVCMPIECSMRLTAIDAQRRPHRQLQTFAMS
jgi:isopenicillin N synthase-like dioxygenase